MNKYYREKLREALIKRGHSEEQIKKMSWRQKFDEFCEWEGLLGYGPTLRAIMAAAQRDEVKRRTDNKT